jgi:mono/diheme cytochrome c family protein
MKKLHWVGTVATILVSASALSGCSGDDPVSSMMTTAGTGGSGTGGSGGSGTGGVGGAKPAGTQLTPPTMYTLLTGADAMPNPTPAPPAWTALATSCTTCHGPNGEGVSGIGPEIRHTPATFAQAVIRGGRSFMNAPTLMVGFPEANLSVADMMAVISWLNTAPKPTTGQGLYKDFCGNCHGPTTPSGGSVPISIQNELRNDVKMKVRNGEGTDQTMRNLYMPAHSSMDLTDAELDLILDFIQAK